MLEGLPLKCRIRDLMTPRVECVKPDDSVLEVARRMRERDIGSFPVCRGTSVLGMITDRDVVLRVLAEGREAGTTPVKEVMSTGPVCCDIEDGPEDVLNSMSDRQVRRIPVLSRAGRLVGLVTLESLAETDFALAEKVLKEVFKPAPASCR
jgi:CBS domain-containing protein